MTATNAKPPAATGGGSEGSGRPPLTDECYAYLTEVVTGPQDSELERIRFSLFKMATTDAGEVGIKARRMLAVTTAQCLPESVHRIVSAFGSTLAGLLYGKERSDRARIARLLNEVIAEATRLDSERKAA